jgi:hypothetical protein
VPLEDGDMANDGDDADVCDGEVESNEDEALVMGARVVVVGGVLLRDTEPVAGGEGLAVTWLVEAEGLTREVDGVRECMGLLEAVVGDVEAEWLIDGDAEPLGDLEELDSEGVALTVALVDDGEPWRRGG